MLTYVEGLLVKLEFQFIKFWSINTHLLCTFEKIRRNETKSIVQMLHVNVWALAWALKMVIIRLSLLCSICYLFCGAWMFLLYMCNKACLTWHMASFKQSSCLCFLLITKCNVGEKIAKLPFLLLHMELPASLVNHDFQGITSSLWKAYSSYALN